MSRPDGVLLCLNFPRTALPLAGEGQGGAGTKIRVHSPSPTLPRKRGRESTELAAPSLTQIGTSRPIEPHSRLLGVDQHKGDPYVVVPPGRSNTPKDQSPVLARAFRAADAAVTEVWGRPPLYLREGGSVPIIADIKRVTGLDSIMLGLFLPEDNLHAPNESFSLDVMKKGIETTRRMLAAIAAK